MLSPLVLWRAVVTDAKGLYRRFPCRMSSNWQLFSYLLTRPPSPSPFIQRKGILSLLKAWPSPVRAATATVAAAAAIPPRSIRFCQQQFTNYRKTVRELWKRRSFLQRTKEFALSSSGIRATFDLLIKRGKLIKTEQQDKKDAENVQKIVFLLVVLPPSPTLTLFFFSLFPSVFIHHRPVTSY